MPSEKAARRALRRYLRNRPLRTRARTYIARARRLMAAGDLAGAEEAVRMAVIALDKAAQKGAIHPNNAARRKSRITRQLSQLKKASQSP